MSIAMSEVPVTSSRLWHALACLFSWRAPRVAALTRANDARDNEATIRRATRLLEEDDLTPADRFLAFSARSRARLDSGDFANARSDAQQALAIDPNSRDAWYNQGIAHRKMGNLRPAIYCFDRSIALGSLVDTQVWRVSSYGDLGEWPAAKTAADDFLRQHPGNETGLRWRAHVLRQLKDYDAALADYTTALDAVTTAAAGTALLAHRIALFAEMERLDDAITDCDTFLALAPRDVDTIARRAELRARTGDTDGAIADYETLCADRAPHVFYDVAAHMRLLMARGDRANALDALTESLTRWPANRELMYLHDLAHAETLLAAGDAQAAQDHLDAAIPSWPRDAGLRALRGGLHLRAGRWREAIADFDVAVRREPDWAAHWLGRASAHIGLGKPYLARADAQQAVKRTPSDHAARDIERQAQGQIAAAGARL